MRRQFLGALLFAGTLAFTACQNETVIYLDENGNPIENVELKEGEGLLKINLSNTSADSRAARPVGSSAAANNVNVVKIYVFKGTNTASGNGDYKFDNTVEVATGIDNVSAASGVITITNFTSTAGEHEATEDSWADHTDQTKTIKLTGLAKDSKYKFVAVGYNVVNPESSTTNPYGEPSLSGEITLQAFTTTALASGKTDYDIEELFAGVSAENATQTDKAVFNTPASVTLTRQVAGMLGYFTKVPTKIDDKVVQYVRVYANDEYTKFKWPAQLLTDDDFNGDTKATAGSSNGEGSNKYLLMEFNMETIATNWNSGNPSEDTYTFSSFGQNGATGNETAGATIESSGKAPLAENYKAPAGLKLVANSIFGGRYIIPYAGHVDSQTLTVELQDASGNALKTLKVTTENAPSISGGSLTGKYAYDIRCNNFYSIGKKLYTDNTGGDPDPDPDPENPDPDEPIDLSSNTNIVVIINDAWEVLHNMGVEE